MLKTKLILLGSDRQSEILTSHLRKLGVTVDYSVKLSSFEQFTDHVTAKMLRHKNGVEEVEIADFSYIVGADGAHSVVRKGAGLAFVGETRAEHMVIGDIHIPRGIPNNVGVSSACPQIILSHDLLVLARMGRRPFGNVCRPFTEILRGIDLFHMYRMSLRPAQKENPDLFNFIITGVNAGLPRLTDRESMMEFIRRVTGVSSIEFGELDFISKYT